MRSTLAGLMCVSEAWTNTKSTAAGAGASGKASAVSVAARQNDPTTRYPVGTLTNTIPNPREPAMRNAPLPSLVTTST